MFAPLKRSMFVAVMLCAVVACGDDEDVNREALPPIDTVDMAWVEPDMEAIDPDPVDIEGDVALSQPVEIVTDALGMPHIYAQTDEDLFFAAGYQVASERLFTLDINRRAATGRLAEVFGQDRISGDIQALTLGFTKWARPSLEAMASERPADFRLMLAYKTGINRRIQEVLNEEAPLPDGFARVGYMPEPITTEDLMAIGLRIQFGYSNTLEFDLLTTLLQSISPSGYNNLEIFTPGDPTFTMELGRQPTQARPLPPERTSAPPRAPLDVDSEEVRRFVEALERFQHDLWINEGSNAWSVRGDTTFNGSPIVANDSHSGFSDPSDLYLYHLNSKEAGGSFDVIGFGFIGIPGVQLGHNDRLTWAATTNFSDMTDLWEVRITRDDETEELTAMVGGEERAVVERVETYRVKTSDGTLEERSLTVREVDGVGVVLSEDLLPVPKALLASGDLVLGWPGWQPNNELFMFLDFDRATTLEAFEEAVDIQKIGMQNWQAATAQGHVYRTSGTIPDRGPVAARGTPNRLMDAEDPDTLWTNGFLPPSRLPRLDGSQPFLMTANNDPWGHTADNDPLNDEFYYGSFYSPGFRAGELRAQLEQLTQAGDITIEQMQQLQLSQKSLAAPRAIPILRAAYDAIAGDDVIARLDGTEVTPERFAELEAAVASLEAWDGVTGEDFEEALLWRVWFAYISRDIVGGALSDLLFAPVDNAQPVTVVKLTLLALETLGTDSPSGALGGDPQVDMIEALADAQDLIDMRMYQSWADLHFARYSTPDRMRSYDPIGGDDTSINVAQARCWDGDAFAERCVSNGGAVFRTITSFTDDGTPTTTFNWPKGNAATTEDWLDGTYRDWPFTRAEVDASTDATATLDP